MRWAIGPYVLRGGRPEQDEESERQPLLEDPRDDHDEPLVDAVDEDDSMKKRVSKKALAGAEEFCKSDYTFFLYTHKLTNPFHCVYSQPTSYCRNPRHRSWSNQANSLVNIR